MNEQEKKDRNLGLALVAGGVALVGVGAYVVHRSKMNNLMRTMNLLWEEEKDLAWQDGYDEAIHRFIQGRMAGNLSRLNNLAAQYPA